MSLPNRPHISPVPTQHKWLPLWKKVVFQMLHFLSLLNFMSPRGHAIELRENRAEVQQMGYCPECIQYYSVLKTRSSRNTRSEQMMSFCWSCFSFVQEHLKVWIVRLPISKKDTVSKYVSVINRVCSEKIVTIFCKLVSPRFFMILPPFELF